MIADALWKRRWRRGMLHPTRERRVCFGELIQIGGSRRNEAQARELLAALAIRLVNCS